MPRKNTHQVVIRSVTSDAVVTVGGGAPIVVQSMTNTDTVDVIRTAAQVADLARAGSELVRITVNNEAAANAVPEIRDRLAAMDIHVPLVGDFHFNGHKLLKAAPACAEALAKYRINPGNVGRGAKRDTQFAEMIEIAARHDKPVRIGANWGSLDQDLLARMLDANAASDNPKPLESINREAVIASALELLQQGIGDTIRISLTPEPGGDRTKEVVVGQEILQTMGLRAFTPMVTACPGCGRTSSTYFQELADRIQTYLRDSMPAWKTRYSGVEDMTVAVMGCVVNGPGESKHADIGISLPGTGETPVAPVYIDGEKAMTLKGDHIAEEFQSVVDRYIESRFGSAA